MFKNFSKDFRQSHKNQTFNFNGQGAREDFKKFKKYVEKISKVVIFNFNKYKHMTHFLVFNFQGLLKYINLSPAA